MDHTSAMEALLGNLGFRRFAMSRTLVGHLTLPGLLDDRPIDFVVDTGASMTFIELTYCRSQGIPVTDTGRAGREGNVFTLGNVRLDLEGMSVRTDGIVALDLSGTNQGLVKIGIDPIRAVIGQDVLRHHEAVIDYASLVLFLKVAPVA